MSCSPQPPRPSCRPRPNNKGRHIARRTSVTHAFADVNGVRLHYAECGHGPLLLLLHGFPDFWYLWRHQLAEFSRDYRVVAVDLRGYNLSSKPREVSAYATATLVGDILALADHFGAGRFTLVGHDWGGAIAWRVARDHASRLWRLVIINAPHPALFARELRQNPAQRRASAYMALFQIPGFERVLAAFRFRLLQRAVLDHGLRNGYLTDEERQAYLRAWAQPGALRAGLNFYRAARSASAARPRPSDGAAKPDPDVPTLVIWGEQDRYLLEGNLVGLEEIVRNLTLRRVPDAGHWIVNEQPSRVNHEIRSFLARTGS